MNAQVLESEVHVSNEPKPCGGVTARVVILSLALAALLGYAIPVIDYKLFNTFLDGTHLPPGAIAVLLVLLLVVNPLLRWVKKQWGLSRNEALTVYITCLFSSLLPGHGAETFVIPNLLAPFYFATRENRWLEFLQPYLKPWLTPALNGHGALNNAVYEGWYIGTGNAPVPWGAWLVPMLFWVPFVLVSYAMLGCLSVMLRAQWAEHEAIAFPLLRLPLQMTEDMDGEDQYAVVGRFFRNPLTWLGFGIAVLIQGMRGLNLYFPDVPTFPLAVDTGPLFSEAPWNQIGAAPIQLYPLVVAVAYLLTSEVSFSLWFFFWFIKAQLVLAYLAGFPPSTLPPALAAPGKMFTAYQVSGCYLAYVGMLVWAARKHLKHIALRAFGRAQARPGESDEVLSYPLAFWGFVLSFAFMVGATCVSGVRFDIALALWASYLVLAIGLSRLVVEAGMLLIINQSAPLGAIARLFGDGNGWLTLQNGLVPASLFQSGIVYHMRGLIMPSFLHSFKLAQDRKIAAKPLGLLIAGVIVISVLASWWTTIQLGYQNGGLQLGHKWFAQSGSLKAPLFVDALTKGSAGSVKSNWFWLSFGALFTYTLMLARSRFLWFPLHPIGYLVCLVFPAEMFWTSIFLGWLAKTLINRFAGNDSVRAVTPAFLGLALGDVSMMLFWLVIDGWQGRTGHILMPG